MRLHPKTEHPNSPRSLKTLFDVNNNGRVLISIAARQYVFNKVIIFPQTKAIHTDTVNQLFCVIAFTNKPHRVPQCRF